MTNALGWFQTFFAEVRKTKNWQVMEGTVEASEWHREANVAVHTTMCIDHYINETAHDRTPRQQILTLVTLLFHDFGKPEAEETLERKDGSGTYHRYAGHEPKSANEFISFMMSHRELTFDFFDQGFNWVDIRKIKWMIEHHLPYGLKNATKRENLKAAMEMTLGDDMVCFYDQLWSDCNGRISDDHATKRQNVVEWIAGFKAQKAAKTTMPHAAPIMYVLQGPVGVGKSTWVAKQEMLRYATVVSEDNYRMEFARANMDTMQRLQLDTYEKTGQQKEAYAFAWKYCFDNSGPYDKYAKAQLNEAITHRDTIILDRTNQTRKSRSPWIQAAKQAGYEIQSVEFYCSEALSHARQKSRDDKDVPVHRAHMIYMAMEVPWFGPEVNGFQVVPTFD